MGFSNDDDALRDGLAIEIGHYKSTIRVDRYSAYLQ